MLLTARAPHCQLLKRQRAGLSRHFTTQPIHSLVAHATAGNREEIAPVVDASSSQSRADVLVIFLSAALLLTGLQWLSLKPKPLAEVDLDGSEVYYTNPLVKLPAAVSDELKWCWDAMRSSTRCKSLVVIYQDCNLLHAGYAKPGLRPGTAKAGDICQEAMRSGQGNYLANLILYPGRPEFTAFLPENTQGVIVQPIGKQGVLIAGTNTVRGFSRLDQAWISTIADKLEVSFEGITVPQSGVGFAANQAKQASRK